MLLADSAQAVQGKLYILGGGWSVTGPDPVPMALVLKIEVPWEQANFKHFFKLELLDADDQPVHLPGDPQPLQVGGEFEVGRPPGMKVGTPLDVPLAINLGPIPLKPDSRYVWRLLIDDKSDDTWRVAFTTRPLPQPRPPLPLT